MARNYRTLLAPVGNLLGRIASTVGLARELSALSDTPESVFRARGTTRQDAIRELILRN